MRLRKVTYTQRTDFDVDTLLTVQAVADAAGTRSVLVARLVRSGLLESVRDDAGEPLVPCHALVRLRRMLRLRRDLGVNFAGACVILDLVDRVEELDRELVELGRFEPE